MMKKQLHFTILLTMLLSMVGVNAWGDVGSIFDVNDIRYKVTKTSPYEVAVIPDYSNTWKYGGTVNIPATVTYNETTYSVTSIEANTFLNCYDLTSVTIPNSMTEIGESAFFSCTKLTSITCWATTPPTLVNNVFNQTLTIYVLSSCVDTYQKNWGSQIKIESIPNATTTNHEVSGTYWSTFYNGYCNAQADNNTVVYKVSVTDNIATLTEIADRIVKAGEGVILKSTADNSTLTYTTTAPSANYDSDLQGVDENTTISGSAYKDKTIYTLANETEGLGFYKYYPNTDKVNTTLAANKAILVLNAAVTAPEFFLFSDGTTKLTPVLSSKGEGREYYTLDGRKLSGKPSQKGLYIVDGKKVVVK